MRHFELNYRAGIVTVKQSNDQFKLNFKKGNLLHAAGDILAFDYGPKENMKRYGSVKPLRYDLGRVTAPVYIFWSETDLHVPKEVNCL